ncbi:hypothetical protein [Nocardia mexicana]|uniref:Uncharacterized protein n=1 Tax=Nocardia mexicana TaxID=279262 RepID=A0A370GNF3_9NOCA|nr:hypothetical protein [Nocardia mexicana]RDI43463.1 hypothetical protein DFR68_12120 [Nocardia mexicana]
MQTPVSERRSAAFVDLFVGYSSYLEVGGLSRNTAFEVFDDLPTNLTTICSVGYSCTMSGGAETFPPV